MSLWMSGNTRELLKNSQERSGERIVHSSSYSHFQQQPTGWQWRELAAPGSWPGLITPRLSQKQPDSGSFCSADWGESRWTLGCSATSTSAPSSLPCPQLGSHPWFQLLPSARRYCSSGVTNTLMITFAHPNIYNSASIYIYIFAYPMWISIKCICTLLFT